MMRPTDFDPSNVHSDGGVMLDGKDAPNDLTESDFIQDELPFPVSAKEVADRVGDPILNP